MNEDTGGLGAGSSTICFVEPSGHERMVKIGVGVSLMEGALAGGVEGLPAECGGACACATCHVYVDQQWFDRLPQANAMERDMLECAEQVRPNSRLSCQIKMTRDLDGMRVEIP